MSAASRKEALKSISSDKGFESVKKLLENAKLTDKFGKDLVLLLSPGLVNTLAFTTHAASIPK